VDDVDDADDVTVSEMGWLAANRAMWDDLARLHASTEYYDLPGVVAGRDDLRPWEDAELGPIDGLDLIHLQCHIGTDTVALARRGAKVVGLDFSASSLGIADQLAMDCGLHIDWVQSDVHEAATVLAGRQFDVVYTGYGALGWLPDLDAWAQVVHDLLRPGGILYVAEIHPMWGTVIEDGRTVCQDAIGADWARYDEDGSYADPEAHLDHTVSYERLYAISDVITAVLDAGLQLELFHEYDVTPAPTPWLERSDDDRLYHFPPKVPHFPLSYSLRARHVGGTGASVS
jgi:2-polyprenyl-3-methyl-5-hydroxy-6-metoxy-1,4-benzoquinol methylase